MPGTEEIAVSHEEMRREFATTCREDYYLKPKVPAVFLGSVGILIGVGFFAYRFVYVESVVRDSTELCYDQVANCNVFNATYLGVTGCADRWRYLFELPGSDTVFRTVVRSPRDSTDCITLDPGSQSISLGLRPCFVANGLCPQELIFCATGGPPCASILGKTDKTEDPDLRFLYGLMVFAGTIFMVPYACMTAYILAVDLSRFCSLYPCSKSYWQRRQWDVKEAV